MNGAALRVEALVKRYAGQAVLIGYAGVAFVVAILIAQRRFSG